MPTGFIGNASRAYLAHTSGAFNDVRKANNNVSSANRVQMKQRHLHPMTPQEAASGGFHTGVGNSTNIVVDSPTYEMALRTVDRIDDRTGELFYRISVELEEMCETSYVIPHTAPRFLDICSAVKHCLREYRSLTEEIAICTRRFVREITEIE